ncbi:DUF2155 domain-containing protein [Hyphomonas sediminis]|uniref:DUF2155 domain-containing protein n=1 Tax=Hyphomonas sediminis TaxID=2866160 RepID=UPI0034E1F05A
MKIASRLLAATGLAALVALTASAGTMAQKNQATLRALDKITGRSTDIVVKVGEPVIYGSLRVELKTCYQAPPEEIPESAAFLRIASTQPVAMETMEAAVSAKDVPADAANNPVLFSGWMYASSPGLNALEHPVYDIWVIRCTAPDPVKLPERVTIPESVEPLYDDMPAGVTETETPPDEDMPID